ncbi:MAG: hypothetical protein IT303_16345 [Dehalococcoidia bacterium]|nr:hypothetical protein [Dehalococcoidia bacterium]
MRAASFLVAAIALTGMIAASAHHALAADDDTPPLTPRGTIAMLAHDSAPVTAAQAIDAVVAPALPDVAAFGPHLDRAELLHVLELAGWPEHLRDQAARVVAGPTRNCPTGESGGYVAAGAGHTYKGLFQLTAPFWFSYAGEDWTQWADPVVNARTAWKVYQYDIARGAPPWTQWTCKP